MIAISESQLRRVIRSYAAYYHEEREPDEEQIVRAIRAAPNRKTAPSTHRHNAIPVGPRPARPVALAKIGAALTSVAPNARAGAGCFSTHVLIARQSGIPLRGTSRDISNDGLQVIGQCASPCATFSDPDAVQQAMSFIYRVRARTTGELLGASEHERP